MNRSENYMKNSALMILVQCGAVDEYEAWLVDQIDTCDDLLEIRKSRDVESYKKALLNAREKYYELKK